METFRLTNLQFFSLKQLRILQLIESAEEKFLHSRNLELSLFEISNLMDPPREKIESGSLIGKFAAFKRENV